MEGGGGVIITRYHRVKMQRSQKLEMTIPFLPKKIKYGRVVFYLYYYLSDVPIKNVTTLLTLQIN